MAHVLQVSSWDNHFLDVFKRDPQLFNIYLHLGEQGPLDFFVKKVNEDPVGEYLWAHTS